MAHETAAFNQEVLAAVAPAPGERILEVGFGHGRTIADAAERASRTAFAGVDVSADALRVAERRCRSLVAQRRVELRCGDAAALPWHDDTFDKAFSVHTLYFWSDPRRELRELARVLKPAGRLVIGFREPSATAVSSFPGEVYRFRTAAEVGSLLGSVGFVDTEFRGVEASDLRLAIARTPNA
jgi:ubiquinone/menaquinone biosynthesis C-methylase UbiE